MYPPEFDYARASSLEEAVRLLSREGAKALAGGQSLVAMLKLRLIQPTLVVDIGRLKELRYVQNGPTVKIGALATHSMLEESPCAVLAQAARRIADPQVRSVGTVGGALAHADPLADWPNVMNALDAVIKVYGPSGRREVKAGDFITGPYSTALQQGELITEVEFPCPPRSAYVKISRRHNDYAIAAVAAAAEVKDGHISWIRLSAIGAADRPIRLRKAEAALAGMPLKPDVVQQAAEAAAREVNPPSDFRASAEYRRAVLKAAVKRALAAL